MAQRLKHFLNQLQTFLLGDIIQHTHDLFGMSPAVSHLSKMIFHHFQHIVDDRRGITNGRNADGYTWNPKNFLRQSTAFVADT
ncbi:hypothetical protein D3C73_1551650 [compost metagenome]